MGTFCASWECHELVPVVGHLALSILIATRPILLEIMENGLPCVMLTSLIIIFFIREIFLGASFIRANKSAVFVFLGDLLYSWSRGANHGGDLGCSLVFLLLLSVEISSCLDPLLLFLEAGLCICDSAALPEVSCLNLIGVWPHTASFDLLELVPVVNYFLAAFPTFFDVVKNWLATMELAAGPRILRLQVLLVAAAPLTLLTLLHYILNF